MNPSELVLSELGRIEPRLVEFAAYAPPETIEICDEVLSKDQRPQLRANAVILACLLSPTVGADFVRRGLQDNDFLVRIASVRCFSIFSSAEAEKNVQSLRLSLTDVDPGVRKYALKAIQQHSLSLLDPEVTLVEKSDPEAFLRALASETKSRLD